MIGLYVWLFAQLGQLLDVEHTELDGKLAFHHALRVIKAQNLRGNTPNIGKWFDPAPVKHKMILPTITPRMKETGQQTGHFVIGAGIGSLVTIAGHAENRRGYQCWWGHHVAWQ